MKKSRKKDESKFDFIEEYAKAVEEAEAEAEPEVEAEAEAEVESEAGAEPEAEVESEAEAEAEPETEVAPEAEAEPEHENEAEAESEETAPEQDEDEDETDTDSPEYRRQMRHKRRVRNQVLAYTAMLIVLAGLGAGVAFAAHHIVGAVNDKREAEAQAAAQAAAEAEAQEEIVVEAPEAVQEAEADPVADNYEEEIPVMTVDDYLAEMVTSTISQMPVEDKIAQLFMVTPEALTGVQAATKAGDGTRDALGKYAVCGLVYDRRNIESEDQLT